jgi:hypothetical protein
MRVKSGMKLFTLAVMICAVAMLTLTCGGATELLAVENRTGGAIVVEIAEVPDEHPLELGASRTANVPIDTMYETELSEITGDSSARVHVTDLDGGTICEHVATESKPAPRLIVFAGGCDIESIAQ